MEDYIIICNTCKDVVDTRDVSMWSTAGCSCGETNIYKGYDAGDVVITRLLSERGDLK